MDVCTAADAGNAYGYEASRRGCVAAIPVREGRSLNAIIRQRLLFLCRTNRSGDATVCLQTTNDRAQVPRAYLAFGFTSIVNLDPTPNLCRAAVGYPKRRLPKTI